MTEERNDNNKEGCDFERGEVPTGVISKSISLKIKGEIPKNKGCYSEDGNYTLRDGKGGTVRMAATLHVSAAARESE